MMREQLTLLWLLSGALVAWGSFCDSGTGWKTVWREDFEGNQLNSSRWTKFLGNDGTEAHHHAGGSRSQFREAWGTADSAFLQDGNLVLRSDRARVISPDGTVFNYTSGAVTTMHHAAWAHGRVCVRAKLPGADSAGGGSGANDGIWPAHWMMPSDTSCWPDHGEIDIMEMFNGNGVSQGTYHWNRLWPEQRCNPIQWNTSEGHPGDTALAGRIDLSDAGWATAWHEYAVEWDGHERMAFVVDGVTILNITRATYTNSSRYPPTHPQFSGAPFYLNLNTAVGGPAVRPVTNSTQFPVHHYIDYVKVSQHAAAGGN